ncbi:menaquinone biosynthesis protein [Helicobacter sp. 16-1353]|uniref:MqnA/MqnD/SBP family protein n=1 Tax=Helicobacter sp. 16-1353 TaxID=2004996 RepID=UPI000DCD2F56|nr:MqnA/MqnD/SBP family protein [Helicobacter sp. 16-1353]RAX53885.1 menaquinone biosynthesis protein [Helicobacter sp. 16-1353]
MRFGKINYLNLAPFDVFIKKYPLPSTFKLFLNHHKSYPSKLNKEFLFRRIDAGFISSIAGMNAKKTKSAIISYGEVWSVIAIKRESKLDYQSASSNALSRILKIDGEILIGDRALRYKLKNNDYIDLGEEWWKKHHLPFAFGLLCYNKHRDLYLKLSTSFNQKNIKIPQYLLENYEKDSQIKKQDIKKYLTKIHYKVSNKPKIALMRFYRSIRLNRIKIPTRF